MSDQSENKQVIESEKSGVEVPKDPVQLAAAVRAQVEYYFSKENLKGDKFLVSQMDSQNSVPISTILNFAKLKALTQDEALVEEALKDSATVVVVEGRVRSSAKPAGRNTIILRDIPADTPEADILEIFNYAGCKPIVSVKSDIGDTWFVVLESEADAKDAVLDLKLKKRTFAGVAVKARLKSESSANRSFFPTPVVPPSIYPIMYPFGVAQVEAQQQQFRGYAHGNNTEGGAQEQGEGRGGRGSHDRKAGQGRGHRTGENSGPRKGNNGKGASSSQGHPRSAQRQQQQPVIEINSQNFPPLPPQGDDSASSSASLQDAATTIGYGSKPFLKYQIDDIINIVKNIKEAELPSTIRTAAHPLAMVTSPNVDLLLRQRTFSIDETRAQMQQGRPVQRDAVISGEVDYNSVMYGEDTGETHPPAPPTAPVAPVPPVKEEKKAAAGGSWAGVLKSSAGPEPEPTKVPGKVSVQASKAPAKVEAPAGKDKKADAGKKDVKKEVKDGKFKAGDKKDANAKVSDKDKEAKTDKDGKAGPRGGRARVESKEKEKEKEAPPAPLKWGDKPSFANVLKANESALVSATEKSVTPVTVPPPQPPAPTPAPRQQRSRSNSESSGQGGKGARDKKASSSSHPADQEGAWSKQKLPPLKKSDP